MPSNLQKLICLILTVLLPATLLAAPSGTEAAGMINVTGKVAVNDRLVQNSKAVFVGDKLKVAEGGSAQISMTGSTLTVGEKSTAVVGSNILNLMCGSAEAVTTAHLGMNVEGVTITPVGNAARYSVSHIGNALKITAIEGSLMTDDGKMKQTVDAGKSTMMDNHPGCSVAKGGYLPWAIGAAVVGAGAAAIILTNRGGGTPLSQTIP